MKPLVGEIELDEREQQTGARDSLSEKVTLLLRPEG